jgi:hypothetical protein
MAFDLVAGNLVATIDLVGGLPMLSLTARTITVPTAQRALSRTPSKG